MIERTLFREEHNIFRESVRRFVEREIVPFHAQWEKDGIVPRELWLKAGAEGLLCCTVPEEYGGLGLDYLFDVIVFEELWRVGASGPGFLIHTDLVATYILSFGTEAQKRHWLPKMVRGEAIGSLGMTEPHAGSDLKAIRTRAVRDGDDYRDQRPEGLHLERPALRRARAGDQDRQPGRRQGHHAVPGRGRPRRLPPRHEPRKARHACAGHVRAVLRERPDSGHQHAGTGGQRFRAT